MAAPIARAQKGIARLFGFGMSTVIFAAVSFASIPAMVAADGAAAGAIARAGDWRHWRGAGQLRLGFVWSSRSVLS